MSKLKKDKAFISAINLSDGIVFLFAADEISEIYNVETDEYIEVPIGFLSERQNANLFLFADNRVLISCLLYKTKYIKKSKKKLIYNKYNPTIMPFCEKENMVFGGDEFINPKSLGICDCELVSFK